MIGTDHELRAFSARLATTVIRPLLFPVAAGAAKGRRGNPTRASALGGQLQRFVMRQIPASYARATFDSFLDQ